MYVNLEKVVDMLIKRKLWASQHVFDLDDTLLRTKDLVVRAYVEAGLEERQVLENWGKPAKEWCRGDLLQKIRDKKYTRYAKMLREGHVPQRTVLGFMANHPGITGLTHCMTGASKDTYDLLQRSIGGLPPLFNQSCGLSVQDKFEQLTLLYKKYNTQVVYYEDEPKSYAKIIELFKTRTWVQGAVVLFKDEGLAVTRIGKEKGIWTLLF